MKIGGNKLKLDSAFCDLHPGERLARGTAKIGPRYAPSEQQTLRCKRSDCDRHFHYDFGYFPFAVGTELEFGDLTSKPRCRNNHDLLYMLMTRIDDVLVYACFYPECMNTISYEVYSAPLRLLADRRE